jgi:hypothetical protein
MPAQTLPPTRIKGARRHRHETAPVKDKAQRQQAAHTDDPGARHWWKDRVRPALARAKRIFPLKLSGIFLLVGALIMLYYFGLRQQDLLLLMASVVLLAVATMDILFTCVLAALTYRWWKRESETLPSELSPLLSGVPGRINLNRRPPWWPLVEVTWRWIEPDFVEVSWHRDEQGAYEQFLFHQRCLITGIEREFQIADVLGFASVSFRWKQNLQLQVLPQPQALNRSAFVTSFHGGDDLSDPRGEPVGDRVDMRQYAAGDPPKLLLWKLFARTGRLMVRMPERAVSPTPRTCAYLVAGPQDEAAAGLLRSILESGVLGQGWRFGADGNQGHCNNVGEALTFLARSGNLSLAGRSDVALRAFLSQAAKDGFNGCLVVLPSAPGPWIEEVKQAARVSGIEVSWAVAPGSLGGPASREWPNWWKRIQPYILSTPRHQQPGEPEKVLQGLAGLGKERWIYQPSQHGFIRYGGKKVG